MNFNHLGEVSSLQVIVAKDLQNKLLLQQEKELLQQL
jgi:hypothetical protein